MVDPRTPGDVLARSVERHKASIDASKDLARKLAEERDAQADASTAPEPEPVP